MLKYHFRKIIKLILLIYFIFKNFFFIILNKKNFKNKTIFIAWHWAFGHQALLLDSIAKYHKTNKKILVLQTINLNRNNRFLPELFNNFYKIVHSYESYNVESCHINYLSLKIICKLLLKSKVKKILFYEDFLKSIVQKYPFKKKLKYYDENLNRISEHSDAPIWVDRLSKLKKNKYGLNKKLYIKCERFFKEKKIEFKNKKNAYFFFRSVQTKKSYYDNLRNSYNYENYILTIKYLANNNYNVFIYADDPLNNGKINNLKNVFEILNFKKEFDISLLNLFIYQISDKIVGQSSGSQILASLMKKKVYILDYTPPFIGFPESTNILLPKFKLGKKILYFNQYRKTPYIYGQGFGKNSFVLSNTSNEIFNFIVKSYKKKIVNKKLPKDLAIYHRKKNRIYCVSDFEKQID